VSGPEGGAAGRLFVPHTRTRGTTPARSGKNIICKNPEAYRQPRTVNGGRCIALVFSRA